MGVQRGQRQNEPTLADYCSLCPEDILGALVDGGSSMAPLIAVLYVALCLMICEQTLRLLRSLSEGSSTAFSALSRYYPSLRTKLRYHELRDIGNNGPYNARVLVYKLNSVYDPSPEVFTTTGTTSVGNHQPEGYDWLASHYRQYRVHSVFYTIKFYTSAHKGFRYFVCAQPSNDTPITSTSQMDALIEGVGRTNQARWGMIFARDSPQGMMVARGKIDIARLEGDFVGRAEADAYAAAVGADPLKVPHIRIFTQVVESTDEIATGDLYAEIDMVYDVEFFEKKTSVIVD